jgi:hypothetical protein
MHTQSHHPPSTHPPPLCHRTQQYAEQLAKYREDPAAFGSDAEETEEEAESSSSSDAGSGGEDEGEEFVDKRLGGWPALFFEGARLAADACTPGYSPD